MNKVVGEENFSNRYIIMYSKKNNERVVQFKIDFFRMNHMRFTLSEIFLGILLYLNIHLDFREVLY